MTTQNNIKYFKGIAWFILSIVISNLNDVMTKYLGTSLHPVQVAFLRFLFGTLSLLPFMVYFGKKSFKTSRPSLHIARGALLFVGISIWCFGLNIIPIVSATLLTFTIPFFVLMMAPIFLNEKVGLPLWVATIIGFIGVVFVLEPHAEDFNPFSLLMIVAAFLFASLDIINKKFAIRETMLSMLFYSAAVTAILAAAPAIYYWEPVSDMQWLLLAVLGACGNLILYCILKAFANVKASDVSPYRYLELILSGFMGMLIFGEMVSDNIIIGALIIIPTTFFIGYIRSKQ